MITKHFFKMVITFIGVLLVGIVVLFAVSLLEDQATEKETAPQEKVHIEDEGISFPKIDE